MIRGSIEVGAASFLVAVVANSIRQALGIVEDRYAGANVQVVFLSDPDAFFVTDPPTPVGSTSRCQRALCEHRKSLVKPKGKVRA